MTDENGVFPAIHQGVSIWENKPQLILSKAMTQGIVSCPMEMGVSLPRIWKGRIWKGRGKEQGFDDVRPVPRNAFTEQTFLE